MLDPTAAYSNDENQEPAGSDPKTNKPSLISLYKYAKKVYGVIPSWPLFFLIL